jgi:hypothetical protein
VADARRQRCSTAEGGQTATDDAPRYPLRLSESGREVRTELNGGGSERGARGQLSSMKWGGGSCGAESR